MIRIDSEQVNYPVNAYLLNVFLHTRFTNAFASPFQEVILIKSKTTQSVIPPYDDMYSIGSN
ncbi:MAG: hypothetical protein JXB24_01275 [Bacteroidales bacterium]|nr:hypothetical protein [Bacteroidales bacterium]